MRDKISKILVKWSMPTRQAAINELLSLFQSEMEKVIGEDVFYSQDQLDILKDKKLLMLACDLINAKKKEQRQKLANLINTIEEVSKR